MKKNEMIVVGIIAIILILVIIVAGNKKKTEEVGTGTQVPEVVHQNKEEYVEIKEDGTKVNISEELSKTKIVEGLEIKNIRLTENNNVSRIIAEVKNPTGTVKGDFAISIKILDKSGKEVTTIGGYIDKVQAGETVELNASATVDFANAYDFEISKK